MDAHGVNHRHARRITLGCVLRTDEVAGFGPSLTVRLAAVELPHSLHCVLLVGELYVVVPLTGADTACVAVIGGLIVSTLLDQIVTPAVFWKFGRKLYQPPRPGNASNVNISDPHTAVEKIRAQTHAARWRR